MIRKFCLLLFLISLVPQSMWAASESQPDFFQSIGKIYVVVSVIAVVFAGLAWLLYRMDRRISTLEKHNNQ